MGETAASFIIALKASLRRWNSVGSPLKVSEWHLGKLCLDSSATTFLLDNASDSIR